MSNKLIKKIKELQKRINSIINELCKEKELIKGSYTYVMKKCSNLNCDCHIKPKHPIHRITWVENGKGKSLSLQKIDINKVKKMIENYRDFKKNRLKIIKMQKKLTDKLYQLEVYFVDGNSAIKKKKNP